MTAIARRDRPRSRRKGERDAGILLDETNLDDMRKAAVEVGVPDLLDR